MTRIPLTPVPTINRPSGGVIIREVVVVIEDVELTDDEEDEKQEEGETAVESRDDLSMPEYAMMGWKKESSMLEPPKE
ncbi:hypothetical protein pipiens_014461 [Culex pipiens pipiens]|uniref:Uncharacterized protein n=1 Tax=Culex pipiens pipiens TaxID=38569 RepID=A0ABD1CUH3_CULPP